MLLISYLVAFLISIWGDEMQSSSIACLPLPDHSVWSAELKKYVSADGKVNYRDWANNQAALDGYLAQLAGTQPLSNLSLIHI